MKNIHPKLYKNKFLCSCGNKLNIWSTINKITNIDICNLCHPYYTGIQKIKINNNKIKNFSIDDLKI